MTAAEIVPAIHFDIMRGGEFGRKIGLQCGLIAAQGGADNLFNSALVQIYAGPEAHITIPKKKGAAGPGQQPLVQALRFLDHHRGRIEAQSFAA